MLLSALSQTTPVLAMASLLLIMVLAFLQWDMENESPSSIAPLTNAGRFWEVSPLSFLNMVGSKPLEHGPVPWGSMLTKWSHWLRMGLSIKGDRHWDSSMKSSLSMPYLLRSKTGMGKEMVDIPELLGLCQDEGTMHPWRTLNLCRYLLFLNSIHAYIPGHILQNHIPVWMFTFFWDRAVSSEDVVFWFYCLMRLGHNL